MQTNNTRSLNHNQLTTIIMFFLIGGSALSSTSRYSGQNAGIILLFAALFGGIIFTLYHRISKIHQHQGLPDILKSTFGKTFGTILLFSYACFFLFRTISVGNYMSAMAQETLMSGVNHRVVITMLLVTVIVSALYGLKVIGRTSEIFMFIIIAFLIPFLITPFTSDSFQTAHLMPILADGPLGIAPDIARSTMFPYAELVVFLMLFPYVTPVDDKKILKRSYIAIIVSTVLMIAIDIITVGLIGATLTSNFEYSFSNAMQLAGLSGFLERLDPLAIVIMVASEYFKLAIYFFITILCFQALHQKFNFKIVLSVLVVVIFFLAPIMHPPETNFLMNTLPFRILPPFQLIMPLIIWIVSEIRFRNKAPKQQLPLQERINPGPT